MVTESKKSNQQPGQAGQSDKFWLLGLLTLVAIVPLWSVRYLVMIDYPNHLARWFVLFHMKDAAYHFANLYAPAWGFLPYISPDVLAMGLQHFLPIEAAGKCIVSLGIILVSLCTYFLLKQAAPENAKLASFGILVALNPMYLMGSISYGYSIAFCLLVVGLWVSYCKTPKAITAIGVVLGLLLVYFTHSMGFVVAGLAMGIYTLFQDQRWKKLGILSLMALPTFLILVFNPLPSGSGSRSAFVYAGVTVRDKLVSLLFPVRLFALKQDLLFLAALALLFLLALRKRSSYTPQPAWIAICATLLLIYFAVPFEYGAAGYFDDRFLPFLYAFLLLAVQWKQVPRYLYIGLALLVVYRVARVERIYVSRQPQLAELGTSFDAIPRDARVLPLVNLPRTGTMDRGDIHYLEYGVIERGFLDPMVFHLQGVQPIRLVGSPYCPNVFCDSANNAPGVDWEQVAKSYDYLWVHSDPEMQLPASRIGDVVFSSDSATVYRIRHAQAAAPAADEANEIRKSEIASLP